MPDPFETLRQPNAPLQPRPAFAADLRRRVEDALGLTTEEIAMTTTDASTTTARALSPQTINPYLCVSDGQAAMRFYQEVFGAVVTYEPVMMDDGRLGHVELTIGDVPVMMAEEFPEIGVRSPITLGGSSVSLMVRVEDCDATIAAAVERGANLERPISEEHGSRSGWITDPFGHRWNVATPLPPAEGY